MRALRFAIKNTIPIFFTYVFIGIAFGILMSDAGYGVLLSTYNTDYILTKEDRLDRALEALRDSGYKIKELKDDNRYTQKVAETHSYKSLRNGLKGTSVKRSVPTVSVGMKAVHKKFGSGTITMVTEDKVELI